MGIDETETPDVIHRDRERGGGTTDRPDPMRTDPERRVLEYRLHHDLVERQYGVARDAWSQALPDLQTTWEKIQEKYPGRSRETPHTKSDGSWVCGSDRRLTPTQNAEVDHGYTRIREVGENDIIPGVRAVEAEDSTRRLAGFEHHFKGDDRLKEKITDRMRSKGSSAQEALAQIPDVVRFTFQYNETTYTEGVRKDVGRLEGQGFIQVERRNTWSDDQYKGINSRWREPESGMIFEVQFHTRASLEAKELTHKAYEGIRGSVQDDERAELRGFQSRANSMIPIPPDVTDIDDYPPGDA